MLRLIILLLLILPSTAKSAPMAQEYGYKQCNHHTFTFLLLKAYDVYLCANNPAFFKPEKIYQTNFSLFIHYNMNFDKRELAQSSIEEMNRYYTLSKEDQALYYQKLMSIFPNVRKADIIEAKYNQEGVVAFYHNQLLTGTIDDPTFSQLFLDIWLYKKNKYQDMTKDLFTQL